MGRRRGLVFVCMQTNPEDSLAQVILDRMKAEIFAGCNILFSGLIAIGERLET